MLLAIDVGNTHVVLGVFQGDRLVHSWRVGTRAHFTEDEYGLLLDGLFRIESLSLADLRGLIISCVVPPVQTLLEEMARRFLGLTPLVVTPQLKTGLTVSISHPEELGADRLVNAVAAYRLYGGGLIVVDFGTATTLCAVSPEGSYLGGIIAPGIQTSAEALFSKAAKLPRISLARPEATIGKDTVHALQSGLVFGAAAMVDGLVHRMEAECGPVSRVVATGGLADLVAPESRRIQDVHPTLTLEGLKMIYDMNK